MEGSKLELKVVKAETELLLTLCVSDFVLRDEQPRGAGAGGARLQDAMSPGLPHLAARADAAVLEEGRRGAAHI